MKQAIHLPESMRLDIEAQSARLEKSPSQIVNHAWELARPALAKKKSSDPTSTSFAMNDETKVKETFVFTPMTRQEIADEAARLDRSLSWVIREAWICAAPEFDLLPTGSD